jgi:Pilus formation protein N terminal region
MRSFCVRSLVFGLALSCSVATSSQAADISVIMDEARLVRTPDRVATVVIGNPAIADAIVQSSGWMVITGKSYGMTNIVALDRSGSILMEKSIEVQSPRDVVVVYRGVDRNTYSCKPDCERRFTLGDVPAYFNGIASEIAARNGLATGTAQAR